jgi:DNA-binding transcriptional ArsR family regulator
MEIKHSLSEKEAVAALAALAQPSRLRIFRQLVVVGEQGLTPGALGELLGVPPATLSFHLKELLHSGLIEKKREGRSLIYSTEVRQMNSLLEYLTDNCCQGEPCLSVTATCKC